MEFTDTTGRLWHCRVTWAAIRRSQSAGVDLSRIEEHLGDFYRCGQSLMDALWAVCGVGSHISQDDFELAIEGETLEQARDALLAGVVAFFPKSRAALIRAAIDEVRGQLAELESTLPKPSTE